MVGNGGSWVRGETAFELSPLVGREDVGVASGVRTSGKGAFEIGMGWAEGFVVVVIESLFTGKAFPPWGICIPSP